MQCPERWCWQLRKSSVEVGAIGVRVHLQRSGSSVSARRRTRTNADALRFNACSKPFMSMRFRRA